MNVVPLSHVDVAEWVLRQARARCTRLELLQRIGDAQALVRAWTLSTDAIAYCLAEEILAAAIDAARAPGGATLYALLSYCAGRRVHRDHKVFRIEGIGSDALTLRFARAPESGDFVPWACALHPFERLAFCARLDASDELPIALPRPPRRSVPRSLTPRRRKSPALPRLRRAQRPSPSS